MSVRDFFCCCRSSVICHFPLSSQGRTCEKNQIFAVFQKQAIFPKFKIFRQNECTRFFQRRRSSPSSVVRHFPLSSQGRTCEKKIKFSPFFKNKRSFQNSRFLGKMSARDFFCCCRSSVIRHFPLSSQGRTCEKNQIFAVFQKQAIFPKFKIFRQNECTRFFRRRRSSQSLVVRHFPLSSQGRTVISPLSSQGSVISLFRLLWKKSNFRGFKKTSNLSKIQDFWAKWVHKIFFAVVGRRSRRSSSFPSFVTGTDLWKKSNSRRFSKTSNLSKIQDF